MMPLQRACGAESQVRNKLSNGPLRVQSNGVSQSILQRVGIRQLPGICWYPAKRTGRAVNQGGTADSVVLYLYLFVLDRVYISVKGVFVLYEAPLTWDISQRSFFLFKEVNKMMMKRWWRSVRRIYDIKQKVNVKLEPI